MKCYLIGILIGLGLGSGQALGVADPVGDLFNPYGLPPDQAPDLVEVSVIRAAGSLEVVLDCNSPVHPADDFVHWDSQILGRIEFGVGDDGSAADSFKSQWYTDPSYLDVLAFLSLNDVVGGQIPLYDDSPSLLAHLPIDFDGGTVSITVPEALLPGTADSFDVLVHDAEEVGWDVFPNGPGHETIVPEPSSLLLWAGAWVGWRRQR